MIPKSFEVKNYLRNIEKNMKSAALTIQATDILLITVNEHETSALKTALAKIAGTPIRAQGKIHREPYDQYIVNRQRVTHVVGLMGSSQSGGSRETTRKALEDLSPKLLIAVGIAWGAWEDKGQKIGDVLISQQVQIGSSAKLKENEIILRGARPEMRGTPVKQMLAAQRNDLPSLNLYTGIVLSMDNLLDSLEIRNQLRAAIPELVGGEMEGQGIYEALRDHDSNTKPDWLIVKGICDWG